MTDLALKTRNQFLNETSNHNKSLNSSKHLANGTQKKHENKIPFYPPSTQMSSKTLKKTIAENNMVPYDNEKATLYSTWTPLSDERSNAKLFDERKQLFTKWFETWNDSQRKIVIEEILSQCKPKQLLYTKDALNKISPVYHLDFTRILPRVICLYIMSFLDPRSLCRSAQVCWYWKMLSESDQLWMPKCLRFGWNLNYIPTSFESGIWKQFYIENIKALQYIPIKAPVTPIATERSEVNLNDLTYGRFGFNKFIKNSKSIKNLKPTALLKQPPWRGNNPNPNHFYRFNYLDEDSAKQTDHLMKTLTLDSTSKKHSTSKLNVSNMSTKAKEDLNRSKIESLLNKGQFIMEQLAKSSKENIGMNSEVSLSNKEQTEKNNIDLLFESISKLHSNLSSNTTSKDRTSSLNKTKSAWTLLDTTENEDD